MSYVVRDEVLFLSGCRRASGLSWPPLLPSSSSSSVLLLHPFTSPSTKCNYHLAQTELLTFSEHIELTSEFKALDYHGLFSPCALTKSYSPGRAVSSHRVRQWPHSTLPAPCVPLPSSPSRNASPLSLLGVFWALLYFSYCACHTAEKPTHVLLGVCPALLRHALFLIVHCVSY